MAPVTHDDHLTIRAGDKTYSLDCRQAFLFGYSLVRKRDFTEALSVFEALRRSNERDRSAAIMLAYCRVSLKDYLGGRRLLDEVFPGEEKERAEQLHTAFVFLSVGMWIDAIRELAAIAKNSPDLPVVCLLAADSFLLQKNQTKALVCWKLAASRDHGDGPVATVARRLFSAHVKRHDGT
jgi:thioredoxin-like negative regulator of GroEL